MHRSALILSWLLSLPAVASADTVLWTRDLGTHRSSLGLVVDRLAGDGNRLLISSDTQGFTDVRFVGTNHTILGQHPGIGWRWDHRDLRPSGLLVSMADHRQPFPDFQFFIDQRAMLIISDGLEYSFVSEVYGRGSQTRQWYLGMVSELNGVDKQWSRLAWQYLVMFQHRSFGRMRLSVGVLELDRKRDRRWHSVLHATAAIRFEQAWTRLR